jgi:hypothetical protein
VRICSPEELETLLEDALLLHDDAAVAALFTCGVLVASSDGVQDGERASDVLAERGYVASARPARVVGGVAFGAGTHAVTVSCRGPDRGWQLLAVVLR